MQKIVVLVLLLLVVAGCTQGTEKQADKNAADQNKPLDANALDTNKTADLNKTPDQNKAVDQNVVVERKKAQLFVFVKDGKDSPVAGAKVSVNSAEEGFAHADSNSTDENGFVLFSVPQADYSITVEKEGFLPHNEPKTFADANIQNILRIKLEKPAPEFQPVKWKKNLNDGNISIDPPGFLRVQRGEKRLVLDINPDFIGELGNKTFEWRMKIIEGRSAGFNLRMELFTPTNKLIKVQHTIDRVVLSGSDIASVDVDTHQDFHTFRLVVDKDEKASLFIDGNQAITGKSLSGGVPIAEPKRMFFESYKGLTSIDYFYVDMNNDGKWDYKEDWDSLDNVS